MAQQKQHFLISLTLLLLLGFLWGTGYSIARFAMTNGVHPFGYSFWQSLGPAIILGLLTLCYKRSTLTSKHWRFYFICGLTGIVIPNTSMYFSAAHLPASLLAMIVNIVPIISYPLALALKMEKFHWGRFLGILMAIGGIMFIILPHPTLPSANIVPWVLLTLVTPISFAICTTYIAIARPQSLDSLSVASGMLISSTILLLPIVFLTHSFYQFQLPLTAPDYIILLEIMLSSAGYLLLFYLIKIAGSVFYSLVDTIVVLTGLFWGHIIFGEVLNQYTSIALLLILFALVLVTQQQRQIKVNIPDKQKIKV